jgi:S1-C subfamily serine protease
MTQRLVIILSLFVLVGIVGFIQLLPDSKPYVVLIRAMDGNDVKWSGSGCFICKDLILTAGHVVKDTKEFEIILPNGKIRPGFFAYQEDPNLTDVGFIRVRGDYPTSRFGKSPHLAQDVWIAGYAMAEMPLTLTKGIVSCTNRDIDFFGRINQLQVDSASWPGHSGSPVLDRHNHIVGILIGGLQYCDSWSICVDIRVIKLSLAKYDAAEALCRVSLK